MIENIGKSKYIRPGDVQPPGLSVRFKGEEVFVKVTGSDLNGSSTNTALLQAPEIGIDPGGTIFSAD